MVELDKYKTRVLLSTIHKGEEFTFAVTYYTFKGNALLLACEEFKHLDKLTVHDVRNLPIE